MELIDTMFPFFSLFISSQLKIIVIFQQVRKSQLLI